MYSKIIGLDLRLIKLNDSYSNFILDFLKNLIFNNEDIKFNLYLTSNIKHINFGKDVQNIIIANLPGSLGEQINFYKVLKKDKNDLVIFFDYRKPIFYKQKYILFIPDLSNIHFSNYKNYFNKYYNNFLFNLNIKNADSLIVFDEITKYEINEKTNILEEKIKVIKPFFRKISVEKDLKNLSDLKVKYNIKGDFYIYDSGKGNNKNLDFLINLLKNLETVNLVILDNETSTDYEFRKKIINNNLVDRIFFLGDSSKLEKDFFYKESLGVLFPLLYTSFPFSLTEAINYGKVIFSSRLKNLEEIFGDKIKYIDLNNLEKTLEIIKNIEKTTIDYGQIFSRFNKENFLKEIEDIIK